MTLALSDTFTGSDGTNLTAHTPDTGGSWAKSTASAYSASAGGLVISNANRVRHDGVTGTISYVNDATLDDDDCDIELDFYVATASSDLGVLFRYAADADEGYMFRLHSTNGWQLYVVNGTFTALDTVAQSLTPGATHSILIEVRGGNFKVYLDGSATPMMDVDDATWSTGLIGLRAGTTNIGNTTGIHIDNLAVNTVAADAGDGGDGGGDGSLDADQTAITPIINVHNLRDPLGVRIPAGQVGKTLEWDVINDSALPAWLTSDAGTVSFPANVEDGGPGVCRLTTGATSGNKANIKLAFTVDLADFTEVRWTVEGFAIGTITNLDVELSMLGSTGVGCALRELTAASVASLLANETDSEDTLYALKVGGARNLTLATGGVAQQVTVLQEQGGHGLHRRAEEIHLRQLASLTAGAVTPKVEITTRTAAARTFDVSRVKLELWHR